MKPTTTEKVPRDLSYFSSPAKTFLFTTLVESMLSRTLDPTCGATAAVHTEELFYFYKNCVWGGTELQNCKNIGCLFCFLRRPKKSVSSAVHNAANIANFGCQVWPKMLLARALFVLLACVLDTCGTRLGTQNCH